jgi:cysteine-rich repeat protein
VELAYRCPEQGACEKICGNAQIDAGEGCDDGNGVRFDGCDGKCQVEMGWSCDRVCTPICGDGLKVGSEECEGADYCDANCTRPRCGNGVVGLDGADQEVCDDGNDKDGDGCSAACAVESPLWECTGTLPSVCVRLCGNGRFDDGEECDEGDAENGDGCDTNCTTSGCGNGIVAAAEACDDDNRADGDGCDADCRVEAHWRCSGAAPSACVPGLLYAHWSAVDGAYAILEGPGSGWTFVLRNNNLGPRIEQRSGLLAPEWARTVAVTDSEPIAAALGESGGTTITLSKGWGGSGTLQHFDAAGAETDWELSGTSPTDLVAVAGGDVVVAGEAATGYVFLARMNPASGEVRWVKKQGGAAPVLDAAAHLCVLGGTTTVGEQSAAKARKVSRVGLDGAVAWTVRLPAGLLALDVAASADGGCIFGGKDAGGGVLGKVAADGTLAWGAAFAPWHVAAVAGLAAGGVLVAGTWGEKGVLLQLAADGTGLLQRELTQPVAYRQLHASKRGHALVGLGSEGETAEAQLALLSEDLRVSPLTCAAPALAVAGAAYEGSSRAIFLTALGSDWGAGTLEVYPGSKSPVAVSPLAFDFQCPARLP